MDAPCPPIALSPFADTQPTGLATRGVLPRHQAHPGRTPATLLQMAGLTDRRDEGGGRPRPHPWHRPQALTDRMGFPKRFELLVVIRPAFLQGAKLVSEWREKVLASSGALRPCRFEGRQERLAALRHAWWQDKTIFP
jgi:hypothetical protein